MIRPLPSRTLSMRSVVPVAAAIAALGFVAVSLPAGTSRVGAQAGTTAIGDPASSRLMGRVTDMVTGRPLAGVRVLAGEADGLTDDDGIYRLSLPPGAYRVRVAAPGYQGVTVVEHELDPLIGDGEVRVDVALPPLVATGDDARRVVNAVRARAAVTTTAALTATTAVTGPARGALEDAAPQRLTATAAVTDVPTTIRVLMPEGQIVALDTDEYLKGVVPAEMGWIFRRAFEALKAQAIASRTYAAAHCLPESAGDPRACERGLDANVDTTTRTQVWRPVHYDISDAAVEATSGLAARIDGALFSTLYFARAAGRTLNSEDSPCCGGRKVDYLRSVASPDPFAVRYGHGAGLSQEGAAVLAEWGASAEEIIDYYYTGAAVAPDPAPAAASGEGDADRPADGSPAAPASDAAPPADDRPAVPAPGADAAPPSPSTEAGTATFAADRFDAVAPGSITARDGRTILSLAADAEPDTLQLIDSPVIRADFPFMALAARWTVTATIPAQPADADADAAPAADGATDGDVLVRVSDDGATWSDWLPMIADDDGRSRSDDHWTRLIVARGRFAQLRMLFRGGADMRAFDQIDLHYFNADAGPPAPLVAAASSADRSGAAGAADADVAAQSIEDTVVKRAAWGADERLRFKDGVQIWPPEYTVPKALIIHHTVTENDPVDPAAVMRAIYYFHAVTRGWGDIGYNFLIDHRGNVYEGRFGGERDGKISQGGHALQFNTNSIGIALLGTFTDVRPPTLSESTLVTFCAAKAFRYRVDPQAGVTLLGTRFAHGLMGHRDALPGHTACPGDGAYGRLDAVRVGVATLLRELGGQPPNPPTAPPTTRPTATATRRPTATPAAPATGVPTPPAGCTDAVIDGGFEGAGDDWVFNRSVRTRFDVLAGSQAAFVGLRNDDPDNGNTYASIVQTVMLPPRVDRAVLRFGFRSSGDDGDRRLVRLMDDQGRVVALGDVSLPASTAAWTVRSFDVGAAIAPLAGKALRIYFGVVNNGDGRRSFVRFDEVRLEVCPGATGQTVDPTAVATATATNPPPSATRTAAAATPRPSPTRTVATGGTATAMPVVCGPVLHDGGFEPATAGAAVTAAVTSTLAAPPGATSAAGPPGPSASAGGADGLGRWVRGGDLPAAVTMDMAHDGLAALRLGQDLDDPDRFGYAAVSQEVVLPANVQTARLSLWVRPDRLADGDQFVVEVRRPKDGVRQMLPLPAAGLPPERWTELSYALDRSTLGATLEVFVALVDRRLADIPRTSAVWVDDIGLDVCHRPAKGLSVPFLAVGRP